MPSADRADRSQVPVATAVAVEVAIVAAMMPSLRVISAGAWVIGAVLLPALLLAIGLAVRRLRRAGALAAVAEALVWAVAVTALFFSGTAWLGLVPTATTVEAAQDTVALALQEMATGVAPLAASPALSMLFVSAAGILAVALDYVVISARLPLLGSVAVIAVAVAPSVAVTGRVDVWQFVLLAVGILALLWTEHRRRPGTPRRLWSGATANAVLIGAVAVVIALLVTPLLPAPGVRTTTLESGGRGIDPSLDLGADLRRPNPVRVLVVQPSVGGAPYLRAATLSTFEGREWQPDADAAEPLDDGTGFDQVAPDDDIAVTAVTTEITVDQLHTPYLPVPFPATSIDGLTGRWSVVPENGTVLAVDADSAGQTYDVATEVPRPTLEQIRATRARGADVDARYTALPSDMPTIIGDLAAQVTADADTDYDRLAALQSWFRSRAFEYSLDAPVEAGFDGSGVDAIAEFLQVRQGYCIHFASAFALMARVLDMPSRIVVGFLPGEATGQLVDGHPQYAVTSDMLHAWPEVYFEGIGWVRFEPTNSLGTATTFSGASSITDDTSQQATTPTTAPTTGAGGREPTNDVTAETPAGTDAASGVDGNVALWVVLAVVLVVAASPGVIGWLRRRARRRRADAAASWLFVQESAIDLGLRVAASDSPRTFGERLVAAGAPPDAVAALVSAVEVASYAPPGAVAPGSVAPGSVSPGSVALSESPWTAAVAVRAGLFAAAPAGRRMLALVAPRSLVIRPGAALAGAER